MKPVLRWAGGKAALAPLLETMLPADIRERRWVEPFCGGAAMFFAREPQHAWLNDCNAHLINFYRRLADSYGAVEEGVRAWATFYNSVPYKKEFYLAARARLNNESPRADYFFGLNLTCFNGLWRENKRGQMNVPWGKKEKLEVDYGLLRDASIALARAGLTEHPYETVVDRSTKTDFLFVDPPYDNGFVAYSAKGFTRDDQAELQGRLSVAPCPVMLTNANTPFIRELYKSWNIVEITARRSIAANGDRRAAKELVIRNY
jgi:DNA adenine methylase